MDRRDIITAQFSIDSLDLSDPVQSSHAYAKLVGSAGNAMVHYSIEGTIFALLTDGVKPFIRFQALLKGIWSRKEQGTHQYRLYETGFFHNLDSNEPIRVFDNPITNESNVLTDIKGGPYDRLIGPRNFDWVISGDDIWIQEPISLSGYFGPEESENQIEQTAFSDSIFRGKLSELADESTMAPSMMTYNYVSPWYPFFGINDDETKIYWQAVGNKIQSWNDLPQSMQEYLVSRQKDYFSSSNPWMKKTSTLNHYREFQKRNSK